MKNGQDASTSPENMGPQGSLFFKIVKFFSRLQLRYLLPRIKHPDRIVRLFVFVEGSLALGVISAVAFFVQFPLLFPPLGPSAFILFRMPMSAAAAPRTVLLSHMIGLTAGFIALFAGSIFFSSGGINNSETVTISSIVILSLAMGLSSLAMIWMECNHPPATATALIVAMGNITTFAHVFGLIVAVVLLITLACLFNRILGGLPYSFWAHDPKVAANYGTLAGITNNKQGYWQQLSDRMFHSGL